MASIEYLDDERKKLWLEINQIQEDLSKKTSDYEKDAKQASKKCSEYRNRSHEAKETIIKTLAEAHNNLKKSKETQDKLVQMISGTENIAKIANSHIEEINTVISKSEMISELFENREELKEKLESLTSILTEGEDSSNKINTLYNSILKRKKELDELFYEINGYEETDSSGQTIYVNGLKDELNDSYNELNSSVNELKADIVKLRSHTSDNYNNFIKEEKEKFKLLKDEWEDEHSKIIQKIKALLPDALTTGLSYAYSEKRTDEIESGKKLNNIFNYAILGLVGISMLPFAINFYLLQDGKTLESVIYDMPRMVIGILPLYIPFLWLAYSSNKKANLSKRLVEEYTHKEVLSKTYEGLSSQIDGLQDSEMTTELKTKLLFNILDVSSENPGKLISDYNKADHPLMDALDKSAKLTDAINSLAKIPGFNKLASILEKKSNEIIQTQKHKVEEALDVVENTESPKSLPT